MPKSPLSHSLLQDALPPPHPPVWQQLPEPHRQQCHDLLAQLLTALMHSVPSEESSHE